MQDQTLPVLHCYRCIYSWTPVRTPVQMCPRCKSKLWDVPKVRPFTLGNGMGIEEVLGPHRMGIRRLARRYGARNVRVFGSVRRREATEKSDVDLLVDWPKALRGADPLGFKVGLHQLLGREVDVVSESGLHWSVKSQVLSEAVPL